METTEALESIKGTLKRVTYAKDDGTWSVAQLLMEEDGPFGVRTQNVTIVGNLFGSRVGESLRAWGTWKSHAKFGKQFEIQALEHDAPVTAEGIEKYLGSNLIQGIGKKLAKRLVDTFGVETLDVIENAPHRLREVDGIGKQRAESIAEAWKKQHAVRRVMVFLNSHGVSPAYAVRIYKAYGHDAVAIIQRDPYRLTRDVFGIGFKLADRVAEALGIVGSDPRRVEAGVLYALSEARTSGHLYLPFDELEKDAAEQLRVEKKFIASAVEQLTRLKRIVVETVSGEEGEHVAVYPEAALRAEIKCAEELLRIRTGSDLNSRPPTSEDAATKRALAQIEESLGIELASAQRHAVLQALDHFLVVITGGPGTGKTTITRAVVAMAKRERWSILLAAPTGRAARRMAEATGEGALTLHRTLEFSFQAGGFQRNADNPLDADLIIVDEASMIDIHLLKALVEAVPSGARLVLVGDIDQLPSVGPGDVLNDLIRSGEVPVARLDTVFRQAQESAIVRTAHDVNAGRIPRPTPKGIETDLYIVPGQNDDDVLAKTLKIVTRRVATKFGFDPISDIQVIAPMHRGTVGCKTLNTELQQALNPGSGREYTRGSRIYRPGDRVMQIRNNYKKEVFNGDIGRVVDVLTDDVGDDIGLLVKLEDRVVEYEEDEVDELTLAYAITAHKSQGSEYPVVVIALVNGHYMLLQRNLLYTAITRARKLCIVVTMEQALYRAVRNIDARTRYTRLDARLKDMAATPFSPLP